MRLILPLLFLIGVATILHDTALAQTVQTSFKLPLHDCGKEGKKWVAGTLKRKSFTSRRQEIEDVKALIEAAKSKKKKSTLQTRLRNLKENLGRENASCADGPTAVRIYLTQPFVVREDEAARTEAIAPYKGSSNLAGVSLSGTFTEALLTGSLSASDLRFENGVLYISLNSPIAIKKDSCHLIAVTPGLLLPKCIESQYRISRAIDRDYFHRTSGGGLLYLVRPDDNNEARELLRLNYPNDNVVQTVFDNNGTEQVRGMIPGAAEGSIFVNWANFTSTPSTFGIREYKSGVTAREVTDSTYSPDGIFRFPDGKIYFSQSNPSRIYQIDESSGSTVVNFWTGESSQNPLGGNCSIFSPENLTCGASISLHYSNNGKFYAWPGESTRPAYRYYPTVAQLNTTNRNVGTIVGRGNQLLLTQFVDVNSNAILTKYNLETDLEDFTIELPLRSNSLFPLNTSQDVIVLASAPTGGDNFSQQILRLNVAGELSSIATFSTDPITDLVVIDTPA